MRLAGNHLWCRLPTCHAWLPCALARRAGAYTWWPYLVAIFAWLPYLVVIIIPISLLWISPGIKPRIAGICKMRRLHDAFATLCSRSCRRARCKQAPAVFEQKVYLQKADERHAHYWYKESNKFACLCTHGRSQVIAVMCRCAYFASLFQKARSVLCTSLPILCSCRC